MTTSGHRCTSPQQPRQQARGRERRQSTRSGAAFCFGGTFGGGAQDGPLGFVPPPRTSSLTDALERAVHEVIEGARGTRRAGDRRRRVLLDSVELLYTSLLVQGAAALQAEGGRTHVGGGSRTRSFRQSFLTSYATRIGERLTKATAQATDAAVAASGVPGASARAGAGTPGVLPVLAARHRAVEEETKRIFPQISYPRSSGISDWEGWTSGRAAADRASLGTDSGALLSR